MRTTMVVKLAMAFFVSSLSSVAIAESRSESAAGEIHYLADGSVVTRNVQLTMERDEAGNGIFTLSAGEWAVRSADAFMQEKRGANIAFVGFKDAWRMDGQSTHLLFKGVKLQGSNGVVYEGTLYKASDLQLAQSGETFEECMDEIKAGGAIDEDWRIAGTFHFKRLTE